MPASTIRHPRLTLPVLCLAVLATQLDTSVANLGLRPIGIGLHAGFGALQWVIDGYTLPYAALLLTGGHLADLYGRRRLFMAGAALLVLASLAGALAPDIAVLIASRVLAGTGAALLVPAALALIRVAWPDPVPRAKALGLWAAGNGVAFAIGPIAGGLMIEHFGWRGIFVVAIPAALAAVALAPMALPLSADPDDRAFDAPAQLLGILILGGMVAAAIAIRSHVGLAAAALLVAILALVGFIRVESRAGAGALVPLDMLRLRPFVGAVIGAAGMTFGMYGTIFLLPMAWLQSNRLDPVQAGLALMPMAVIFAVVSSASGHLAARWGLRRLTAGGVALIGTGLIIVGGTIGAALIETEVGLILTGIGMGLATGALMGEAVGAVPAARSGTASALINVARMTGAATGVAAMGTVYALAGGGDHGILAATFLGGGLQGLAAIANWKLGYPKAGALGLCEKSSPPSRG